MNLPSRFEAPAAEWHTVLHALLNHARGALTVKDAETGRYEHADPAFLALADRLPEQVLGRTDAEVFDAALAAPLRAADQTAAAHDGALTAEHRFDWKGRRQAWRVLRVAVPGPRRRLYAVWFDEGAAQQRDEQLRQALAQIEQQQRTNDLLRRELADQALRDPASGLYARAHFEDQLRREVDLSMREHREFALVFIDVDEPSGAVAGLGEPAQARVFEAMGRLLRGGTRAMDASCRFHDRRFAVLLSGVGLATAHSRMEGLRRQCATQIVVLDGQELGFTVSMGVASFPHTAHTQAELVTACEAALAEARRRGGNHVTLAAIRLDREPG